MLEGVKEKDLREKAAAVLKKNRIGEGDSKLLGTAQLEGLFKLTRTFLEKIEFKRTFNW